MPNRIIREGLLDSQRYWSVSNEARLLFVHLMLLADDFGLVSLAPVFVRRRCFDDAPPAARIDKMIEQLHDVDLIRVYQTPRGNFAFIPRFRQRLQRHTLQYPKPPRELYSDDVAAAKIFSNIKDLDENSTDAQPLDIRSPTAEVKGSEVKGSEEKKALVPTGTRNKKACSKSPKPYTPEFDQAWLLYPRSDRKDSKRDAFRAWNSRRKEGHTVESMTNGIQRYAKYCREGGITGSQWVKSPHNFLGAKDGEELFFLELWEPRQQSGCAPDADISSRDHGADISYGAAA